MKLKLILLLTIAFTFMIILTSIEVLATCVIEDPPGNFMWDSTNPLCRCTCTSDAQCISAFTIGVWGLGGYATTTGNACTGAAMIEIDEQNRYFYTTCDDPDPILNAPYPDGTERLICPNEASWFNPDPQYSPQVRLPICDPGRALPGALPCGLGLMAVTGMITGCMTNENPDYYSPHFEPDCKVCLECNLEGISVEECPDANCLKWDRSNCYYKPLVKIRPYNIDWDLSGERNQRKGKYYCNYTDQLIAYMNDGTPIDQNKPLFEVELSGDVEICDAENDPDSCKDPCPDDTLNEFYDELNAKDIGTKNLDIITEAIDPGTTIGNPHALFEDIRGEFIDSFKEIIKDNLNGLLGTGSNIADLVGGTPPPYSFEEGSPFIQRMTTTEKFATLVEQGVIPEGKSVFELNLDAGVPYGLAFALGTGYEVGGLLNPTSKLNLCQKIMISAKAKEIEKLISKIQKMPTTCDAEIIARIEEANKAIDQLRRLLQNLKRYQNEVGIECFNYFEAGAKIPPELMQELSKISNIRELVARVINRMEKLPEGVLWPELKTFNP